MQTHHGPLIGNLAVLTAETYRGKLQVTEYVDVTTGEILPAEVVQKMGVRHIRPDTSLRRAKKLDNLRKEPREFADFLLQFRNGRCGFLMPVGTLVGWYSKITRKRPDNIKRYFTPLIEAGVIDSGSMLHKDFMINNPQAGKEGAIGEKFRAYNIFDSIRSKQIRVNSLTF